MSLLAHRFPADLDRASVVLPTVKCTTCAGEIPLNSLGEHVCTGGAPSSPYASSQGSSSPSSMAGSPLSRFGALPKVPQQQQQQQRPGAPPMLKPVGVGQVYGPSSASDYSPSEAPMSAISQSSGHWPGRDDSSSSPDSPLTPLMIDTTSGGNAGMAGVGRRAFAAAAWGVRAGVALASATGRGFVHEDDQTNQIARSPLSQTQLPLSETHKMPEPKPTGAPSPKSPRGPSPKLSPALTTGPNGRPNRSPTAREPIILPKAPLAGRAGALSRNEDHRSASRNGAVSRNEEHRSESRNDDHSRSVSRNDDYPPARPQLERSGSTPVHSSDDKPPSAFFDRYRQMMRSKSDQTHTQSGTVNLTTGDDHSRYSHATSLDDTSSLPWATSSPDEDEMNNGRFEHHRHPTSGSISSSVGSSASGGPSGDRHDATSLLEAEVVITPSQSWEGGLAERSGVADPKVAGYSDPVGLSPDLGTTAPGVLALIGEEEEEDDDDSERFGFGAPKPLGKSASRMHRSSSQYTLTPNNVGGVSPPRARAPPTSTSQSPQQRKMEPPRMGLAAGSVSSDPSPPSQRAKRVCARCGDAVGGSRRYVERDGIILCETDWKKMYLPACRRCKLPIEKSAVSSSDGQLKGKWHRACFTCTRCDSPFEGDDFYVHDGRPWCQYHYAEENGTLCAAATCRKPIEGPCILAPSSRGDERFHPGHLRCEHRGGVSGTQSCREAMTEYFDVGGSRYCERHAGKAARRAEGPGGVGTQRAEKRRTKLIELPRVGL